jgi:hypothetical protein
LNRYKKEVPLIFIHIPKCAGTTVNHILKLWYKDKYLRHEFNEKSPWYTKEPYQIKNGICISGHFNRRRNRGIEHLYPTVNQFITFIREPVECAVSQYFFWKRKRRKTRIELGTLIENSYYDYINIEDFFLKRPNSTFLKFLPKDINPYNYKTILDQSFIHIGIVEKLQDSVNLLAEKLGFETEIVGKYNISERNEFVPDRIKMKFRKNNSLEYKIYNYIYKKYC